MDKTIQRLKRIELAHILKGMRAKDPDKRRYHTVMVLDCRAKIEYIGGLKNEVK